MWFNRNGKTHIITDEKRRVFIPPWCFQYLAHEHAASLGLKRHHINRIHQSGKCLVKRGTQINKQRSDCCMFIYELKVAIDSHMPLPLETGRLWYKPTWHAGTDGILNFLHIDSETACALTNQSSSIHLWLTVEAGSQREPLKRVVELNDGSSNYGEIQLHVHRGSKGVLQDPAGLRHVGWNMTVQGSHRPSAARRDGHIRFKRLKNRRWPTCIYGAMNSDIRARLLFRSHPAPSVCGTTSSPYDPCRLCCSLSASRQE